MLDLLYKKSPGDCCSLLLPGRHLPHVVTDGTLLHRCAQTQNERSVSFVLLVLARVIVGDLVKLWPSLG